MPEPMVESLGRYTIRAELGRGGFATVYRALDTSLDREVALKVLHPQLLTDRSFAERFRREARALAALRHPHIVTVYEVGEADGRLYIAMELAKGTSLAQAIAERGRLPWSETLALLRPVCEALDYAHGQGVVHRDLKPSNILLDKERGTLLTDFGFARLMGESSVSMSLSGGILGTPAYIAPEVWELEAARPTADIYALGCILYELLTGEVLFAGKTPMQAMRAHDRGPQLPPASAWPAGVPSGVEVVLRQALARQPEARFPSASAVWLALNDLEAEAKAGRERAERAAVAAQWRTEAEAALAAGEWGAARMAVGRWLAITPDDVAALAMRQEIDRRESEAHAQAEAEQRTQREAEERQRREAERKAAQEGERKAREEQARKEREEQAEREREAERLRRYRLAQAGQQAEDTQTRKPSPEQAEREREVERLRQYRLAQEAEEQKARKAAQLAEEEKRRRETSAAQPAQKAPEAREQLIGYTFAIWWTLASIIGTIVGIGVGVLINYMLYSSSPLPAVIWFVAGAVVGVAQFFVLRRYIPNAGVWIPASAVDWGLGLILGMLIAAIFHLNDYGIGISVAIGITQWMFLRQKVSRAGWWIPISIAGWTVCWAVNGGAPWPISRLTSLSLAMSTGLGSGFTGFALLWLLNSNRDKPEAQQGGRETLIVPSLTSKLRLPTWAWIAIVISVLACLLGSLLLLLNLGLVRF